MAMARAGLNRQFSNLSLVGLVPSALGKLGFPGSLGRSIQPPARPCRAEAICACLGAKLQKTTRSGRTESLSIMAGLLLPLSHPCRCRRSRS